MGTDHKPEVKEKPKGCGKHVGTVGAKLSESTY
jgi:hypothetical protein